MDSGHILVIYILKHHRQNHWTPRKFTWSNTECVIISSSYHIISYHIIICEYCSLHW